MAETYNLSDGVQEYFEFILKGHHYRFRHLTTEELDEFKKLKGDELQVYIYKFITKVDPASPEFSDIAKTMISPEWANFTKMVTTEFTV